MRSFAVVVSIALIGWSLWLAAVVLGLVLGGSRYVDWDASPITWWGELALAACCGVLAAAAAALILGTSRPGAMQPASTTFVLGLGFVAVGVLMRQPLASVLGAIVLLAGIVANGGIFVPPRIVDEVQGGPSPESAGSRRVVDDKVAAALAHMMRATITEGTARAVFQRDRWSRGSALREVRVAGKTGSIADRTPYRDYSWFVGFAPVEDPRVAVATVIVNERVWRVKAPWVAHHALEAYFSGGWERHAALRAPDGIEGVRTASR